MWNGAPFAIINANNFIMNEGKMTYVRKNIWGTQDIEDPKASDFKLLYSLVTDQLCIILRENANRRFWSFFRKYQKTKQKNEKFSFSMGKVFGIGVLVGAIGTLGIFLSIVKKTAENTSK